MAYSSNNNITDNHFENDGIYIWGYKHSHYNTHTIKGNTINGRPIYYYKDTNSIKVPEDAGEVILANCTDMIVENINASYGSVGIEFAYTRDSKISNNTVNSNSYYGIYLYLSSNNTLKNNTVNANSYGIYLYHLNNNNTITNNTALSNNVDGIFLAYSSNNNIITSNIVNSGYNNGIYLYYSNNNTLAENTVSSNRWDGIYLYSSNNNNFTNNNASHNYFGIRLYYSSNNTLYLNNLINNTQNAHSFNSTNIWNSTEKISYFYNGSEFKDYLGNYWSDYTDKHPDAEEIDSTGIWDTPYSIDSDEDNYPLMNPFENYISEQKPDLTITNISWNPSNPKEGDEVFFNYTIKNQGTVNTTDFTTALYIDDERFDISARTSLEAGETQERFFTRKWIATAGNHSIKIVADDLSEIDESDERNNETVKWLNVAPLFIVIPPINCKTGFRRFFERREKTSQTSL